MPNWFFDPLTDLPSRIGKRLEEYVDPSNTNVGDRGIVQPFIAGSLHGAGDMLSDMTSPFSLATMATPSISRAKSIGTSLRRATAPLIEEMQASRALDEMPEVSSVLYDTGNDVLARMLKRMKR
jgi:hypothetical protein